MPGSKDSEDYEIPETYLNLDEVVAPSQEPSDRFSNRNRQVYRRSLDRPPGIPYLDEEVEQEQQNLPHAQPSPGPAYQAQINDSGSNVSHVRDITELAVLPPIGANNRREDEEDTENSTIWRSPRDRQAAGLATQAYTVSYLVLFSILGTLARLGLQALNTYPGAPLSTGVLWANFAGSAFMGFLSEDRKLFVDEYGMRKRRMKQPQHFSPPGSDQTGYDAEKELEPGVPIPSIRTSQVGVAVTHSDASAAYPVRRGRQTRGSAHGALPPRNGSPHSASMTSISPRAPSAERRRHLAAKKGIPLFIGLATGFCGSITSFSSFQRDAYLALSNSPAADLHNTSLPVPRNGGYSFLALLATLILTPGLCLFALVAGAHLALFLDPFMPPIPFTFTRRWLDRAGVFFAWGCWVGAVIFAIWPPDRLSPSTLDAQILPSATSSPTEQWRSDAIFAVVFAPVGCLARFYISMALNSRLPSFPLGTFVVNILGTLLEAGFYDLQRSPLNVLGYSLVGGGRIGCQVLQGMMDGFCGCLTTVSTWIAELGSLRRGPGWVYGWTSLLVGLAAAVVVMGPVEWTLGFSAPVCGALAQA